METIDLSEATGLISEIERPRIDVAQWTELRVIFPLDSPQSDLLIGAVLSGEKYLLKMPFGLHDQAGYITSVGQSALGLEVSINVTTI